MNISWNSSSKDWECLTFSRHYDDILVEIIVRMCLIVFGTTFNVLVCLTFWKNPRLVSKSTLLLCNLSATDLVMSLVSIPASLQASFWQIQFKSKCALLPAYPWNTALIIATFTASISNLVFMSLDRCFMIRFPITYRLVATTNRIKSIILLIWAGAVLTFICMATKIISQDFFTKASFSILTLFYLVILISYLFVFLGIKKQNRAIANDRTNSVSIRQQITEKELAKTIAIIIIVFSFSWAPLGYTMIRYSNFETLASRNPLIHWAATVGMTTAVANPLIYFGRKKEYREAAVAILKIRPAQ